ncbi:hypothetical protein EDB87DRAFT_1579432 [Lactarius vividus]|nr:hypothetical protein EDB87DRAFT_1579432 [Lactarius vividus]
MQEDGGILPPHPPNPLPPPPPPPPHTCTHPCPHIITQRPAPISSSRAGPSQEHSPNDQHLETQGLSPRKLPIVHPPSARKLIAGWEIHRMTLGTQHVQHSLRNGPGKFRAVACLPGLEHIARSHLYINLQHEDLTAERDSIRGWS